MRGEESSFSCAGKELHLGLSHESGTNVPGKDNHKVSWKLPGRVSNPTLSFLEMIKLMPGALNKFSKATHLLRCWARTGNQNAWSVYFSYKMNSFQPSVVLLFHINTYFSKTDLKRNRNSMKRYTFRLRYMYIPDTNIKED